MGEWSAPALPAGWTASGQPPFVARRDEVAALEAAWADARSGAGRAVFVSGEPGWGKSRLVSEVCTRLHASGAAVLVGTCIQELGAPFEPFDEPLRALLPALRATTDAAGDEPAELLERVLAPAVRNTADPPVGQEHVFAAVVDVLRAAAAVRPFVLVLDDLHWAGPAAVQLLRRVTEGTADARVLLISMLRGSPPDRSDSLADALVSLSHLSGVQRLELSPFTPDEVVDYVAVRSGVSRSRALEPAQVLRELTGGNPFLLRAMWRPVVDAERQGGERRVIELPDSVSDLVRSRVALLDDAQRTVLGLAAVLGQEVDLTEVLGISAASVDVTLGAMDAAVRTRLMEAPVRAGDPYRFPHAIARQAVIDLMPGTEVLRAHARIAQTLEADFPTAPRLTQRLAHHYAAARALGFGDRAVTYLAQAGELAEGRYAYEDAGRLFERAAEISPDSGERAELLLRAAGAWDIAADTSRARALFEQAADFGDPRQRVRAAIGYEDASWRPGRLGHRAFELLSSGLSAIPHDEADPLYVEALGSLARATAFTGAVDDAEMLGDRAVALARALGDRRVLASVLRSTASLTVRPRGIEKRRARGLELLDLTRSMDDEWMGAATLHVFANSYVLGDSVALDRSERDLMELTRRWSGHWNYWFACARFGRALIAGRLDDATIAYGQVQRDEIAFRADATGGASGVQGYMLRRESGRLESVRRFITGTESPTKRWAPGLLALYTEFGLDAAAQRLLDWMIEHAMPNSDSSDWPARLAFMAEAAARFGDAASAERLHPWISEYAGLNLMSGIFVAPFGPADHYLGELESLLGTGAPRERFERALELAERTDASLHVARTLASMATHLRRADPGSREAAAYAERARAIAEPAGLVRVLRALDAGEAASAHGAAGGLTARECDVIRLVAEGRSNRDIAAELVISEHTAANHVRNILTKIGAVNRTQAAMFAREHGLA